MADCRRYPKSLEALNWALAITLLVILAACTDTSAPKRAEDFIRKPGGEPLEIVCTTTMIADLARQIAGEDATVIGIMRDGEDPHIYEPRPRHAQLIGKADVILLNGLHLEATLLQVVENHAKTPFVVRLAESQEIQPLGAVGTADLTGAPDPHCWLDVRYFVVYAEQVRDILMQADPEHAENYRRRAEAYIAQLQELDQWVQEQLDSIPRERRIIITSHDAFNYYGKRYGVEVHGVIGISTDQQPRPQDVIALEKLVKANGIKALFIETSVSNTLNEIVRKVAASTGANIGGTLYSDSLGPREHEAGTYIGMVRHNTRVIANALK